MEVLFFDIFNSNGLVFFIFDCYRSNFDILFQGILSSAERVCICTGTDGEFFCFVPVECNLYYAIEIIILFWF